jgi:hypothetical protein
MLYIFTILHVGILHTQSVVKSPVPCVYIWFTVLHVILVYMYIQYTQGLIQSSLVLADHALTHAAHVTTATYSLGTSYVWPPPRLSLLYFLCLASPFRCREHLHLHDFVWSLLAACTVSSCNHKYAVLGKSSVARGRVPSGAENLVLQGLQFQKLGIYRKFPGGAKISDYWFN